MTQSFRLENVGIINKDKKLTQKDAEDLIVDGKNKEILAKLAILQGNAELAKHIQNFNPPQFPVTGNDLIAMGYKSGPELGQTLNRVKSAWKQSNFTANKDDLLQNLKENFADGKKKGKSRPGRVKKSGASCKGSVTSLRAKAKKASGERAKMYHWCANMKAGKK